VRPKGNRWRIVGGFSFRKENHRVPISIDQTSGRETLVWGSFHSSTGLLLLHINPQQLAVVPCYHPVEGCKYCLSSSREPE